MVVRTYGHWSFSLGSAWSPGNFCWVPLGTGETIVAEEESALEIPRTRSAVRICGQTPLTRGRVRVVRKGTPILGLSPTPIPDAKSTNLRDVEYIGSHSYTNEIFSSGELGWIGKASNGRWGVTLYMTGSVRNSSGSYSPVLTCYDQNGYVTAYYAYSQGNVNYCNSQGLGRLKSWWYGKESMVSEMDTARSMHASFCLNTVVGKLPPRLEVQAYDIVFQIQPPSERDLQVMINDSLSRGQAKLQERIGELTTKVVNSYGVTGVDMIENATQLKNIGDTFKSFLAPIVLSPKGLAKATAGRKLSYEYGDRLTAQDAAEVSKGILSVFRNGVTRGDQTRRTSEHFTQDGVDIRLNFETIAERYDDALTRTFLALNDWGLLPTPNTVWNLIPFSFCVDWFFNVEEYLSASKARTMMNCYAWKVAIASAKVVQRYDRVDGGYVEIETYSRSVSSQVPVPDVDLAGHWASLHQLVNGACLIVQVLI